MDAPPSNPTPPAGGPQAADGTGSPPPPPGATATGGFWRALRKRAVFYSGAYAVFCLLFMIPGCAEKLLLFPSTEPVPSTARQRLIPFNDGDLELRVDRLGPGRSDRPDLFILEFLGNAERAEYATRLRSPANAAGLTVEIRRMNYPGFGASDGPARLRLIPPAALAAYDDLAAEAGDRPIVLSGSSLGTSLALYVAGRRRCAGVILQNPPPLQNLIVVGHGWWNLWVPAMIIAAGVPGEMNSLLNAPRVDVPAIFIMAQEDEVVPIAYQRKVLDAYAGPKQTILRPGADHNSPFSQADNRRVAELFEWLLQESRRAPAGGNGNGN